MNSLFRFVDQPSLVSQRNFEPVKEIGEAVQICCSAGQIPHDFPDGAYVRNGPNPLCGALKTAKSIFGRSDQIWVEGEGMLHAVYFNKMSSSSSGDNDHNWKLTYKNRYIETETLKLEKQRQKKPGFLPALEGDSAAILAAYFFNFFRFGQVNKHLSSTNVFEHSGKLYTIGENSIPHEIDIHTLETKGVWEIIEAWAHPRFTNHPKRAPSGELVVVGVDRKKPYLLAGVISADGKELVHKVDLERDRVMLSHDVGVTQRYNVIWDHPVVFNFWRLVSGDALLKYDKQGSARIGVMPRYGDAGSIRWFDVETYSTYHTFNCFEDGNEVVIRESRPLLISNSIPGPVLGAYEWRLDMETGGVKVTVLSSNESSLDFPFINPNFTGLKNKFGYAEVIDSQPSSQCGPGMLKYRAIAKLHFDEPLSEPRQSDVESKARFVKIEFHHFEENTYCSGSAFVPKVSGSGIGDEDSGWIVTYVHNEDTEKSQVYVIDSKKFGDEPIAKIDMPQRVPYGFHGTFVPTVYK